MQALGEQQITKLKEDFVLLDTDKDGYINRTLLQSYMKQIKMFQVPVWKVKQFTQLLSDKISQDDFIVWIMGHRSGFQDLAKGKFIFSKFIQKVRSAGPSSIEQKIKTSQINFNVNKNSQQTKLQEQHFFKLKAGLDRKQQSMKKKELQQVLGRTPSQINLVFKLKTLENGKKISEKLSEIAELALALASQLGPTATPIVQSISFTSKWHNEYVYLIVQLNNAFMNLLLKFMKQAIEQLIPEGKCYLSSQIQSDFSQVLQQSFDPLNQSLEFNTELLIGEVFMSKLKELIVQEFNTVDKLVKPTLLLLFLFEGFNLSMDFSNWKQCLKSFQLERINEVIKQGTIRDHFKSFQIAELIKQFLPDGDQLLKSIKQNCTPEGSLNLNISDLSVDLSFNFNIQSFFDIL